MDQTDKLIQRMAAKDPTFMDGFKEECRKLDASVLVTQLRQSQKMSQETLAKKAKVSKSTIARIENGNMNPTLKTLEKLGEAAGKQLTISYT
ncbi:helix-turn-helix transcriptional regulator [Lactobacillus sp. ESL0684]|uniref:helix-turn-helix domain-containing protein n=1 Tax=Lactobacillus sp. ESL0684 TaxID=2983213 RepID=UPI0023F6C8EE|nr:helix-turn-helix transcriptional regulator [Lactobacillus sp. ESL0684]WEV43547.1 helix-turn-helix transcriptional regulator [Lactobacillus sp. ESL0684]